MTQTDRRRLLKVKDALGGSVEALRDLNEVNLGARDLEEADRRARVVAEWRVEMREDTNE